MQTTKEHRIYQIFYDDATKASLDTGFLPLNNMLNERPDWSEYWPIRYFLLNNDLENDTYYGFFSPKFKFKTTLTSSDVHAFLDSSTEDVVSFSPCFDHMSLPMNPFEQASFAHEGSYSTIVEIFKFLDPSFDIVTPVMSTQDTIFSNFFAAKKEFWREWLINCEKLFQEAESSSSEMGKKISSYTGYDGKSYPLKVFIMERVASFMLLKNKAWRVRLYNPINRPFGLDMYIPFQSEMIKMDALKRAYADTGFFEYFQAYCEIRNHIVKALQQQQ